MRVHWAIPVTLVAILASSSLPASACIPGMPEVEFEAQAVSCGTAFLDLAQLTATTSSELFPQTISFQDRLYVVWQKEDFNGSETNINGSVKYHLTLISFDGTSWGEPLYLSSPDIHVPIRSQLNLNPRLGAGEDVLYMAWTSNEPNFTTGADDDVVFRFTEDGETWSEPIEVTGHYNTGLDKLPCVVQFQGRAWFLWETNDQVDSDGRDMDIVMRSWDGSDLGPVLEVTPPGDYYNDYHVQVAADDDWMYITWMKANYTSGANVNDVWGRIFDGEGWATPPMRLNSDMPADNEHPAVAAADGRCFFVWEAFDTGKIGDVSSIIMREWSPEEGLTRRVTVSSLTSNGRDTTPSALWYRERLFISWISTDQGVTFGDDADLVYRVGAVGSDGDMHFDDIVEVSTSTDDFEDRFPSLVVYDDIVNAIWVVDINYSDVVPPEKLAELGGIYRSPDVCIQSIDIPFEKQLSLVYTLGTAFPVATKPTAAKVTVNDLRGEPREGLRVNLRISSDEDPGRRPWNRLLRERGGGVYDLDELEFPAEGAYSIDIVVNGVVAGSFVVDVTPPPPSFTQRVPVTALFFVAVGAVMGLALYRMMGRDELVDEPRPAPLARRAKETV